MENTRSTRPPLLTYAEPIEITGEIVAAVRRIIHGDKEVYDRVLSYWSDGFFDHEEFGSCCDKAGPSDPRHS